VFSVLFALLVLFNALLPGIGLALLPSLVGTAAGGLVIVLIGHLAAALFDVADSFTGPGPAAPENSSAASSNSFGPNPSLGVASGVKHPTSL
jgi:hypothetical protein